MTGRWPFCQGKWKVIKGAGRLSEERASGKNIWDGDSSLCDQTELERLYAKTCRALSFTYLLRCEIKSACSWRTDSSVGETCNSRAIAWKDEGAPGRPHSSITTLWYLKPKKDQSLPAPGLGYCLKCYWCNYKRRQKPNFRKQVPLDTRMCNSG